jgi:hypothetical protein
MTIPTYPNLKFSNDIFDGLSIVWKNTTDYWQYLPVPEVQSQRFWHIEAAIAGIVLLFGLSIGISSGFLNIFLVPLVLLLIALSYRSYSLQSTKYDLELKWEEVRLQSPISLATSNEVNEVISKFPLERCQSTSSQSWSIRQFHEQAVSKIPELIFGYEYLFGEMLFPYSSDFEIPDLKLQINIVKPYDLKSRHPLHLVNDSDDLYRDAIFNSNGWTILKLTEFQILTNPVACLAIISIVIDLLKKRESEPERLILARKLKLDPCWDLPTVNQLMAIKYREKYLRSALVSTKKRRSRQKV